MQDSNWRTQTPPAARAEFLRVLGPWASTTLELRRRGLTAPTLASGHKDSRSNAMTPGLGIGAAVGIAAELGQQFERRAA